MPHCLPPSPGSERGRARDTGPGTWDTPLRHPTAVIALLSIALGGHTARRLTGGGLTVRPRAAAGLFRREGGRRAGEDRRAAAAAAARRAAPAVRQAAGHTTLADTWPYCCCRHSASPATRGPGCSDKKINERCDGAPLADGGDAQRAPGEAATVDRRAAYRPGRETARR